MAREFRLPDLGSGLKEGRILRWCVAVGDQVATDGVLCELETEKAVIEVPIPFDGVVLELGADEDATVEVGSVLVVIGAAGETTGPSEAQQPQVVPEAPAEKPKPTATEAPQPVAPEGGRVRAMPSIRRLARQHGIDLSRVRGTGKRGHITRADVESALSGSAATRPVPTAPVAGHSEQRQRMSMLRTTIADRMTRSWQEIPHVFTRVEVDASRFLDTRRALGDKLGRKVPVEALLIKAVVPALKEFPQFNASIEGDEIVLHGRYDVGVAVDTDDGLIVPVVRGADLMSVEELVDRLTDLVARTMSRKASPEELSGGTFTVNNIGAGGHLMGTSIIPYGTTAILSVGRAEKKPVVRDDEIVIRPMMEVSLCFDHRAVDGGHAQRFMQRVRENLEQPVLCLMA
jgi:pyruvate dehydrogenase E2 component (dihydrolipoamide acetyltransferase)